MYGRTVQVTISIPIGLLTRVDDIAAKYSAFRAHTTAWLIHMGLVYLKLLKEKQKD